MPYVTCGSIDIRSTLSAHSESKFLIALPKKGTVASNMNRYNMESFDPEDYLLFTVLAVSKSTDDEYHNPSAVSAVGFSPTFHFEEGQYGSIACCQALEELRGFDDAYIFLESGNQNQIYNIGSAIRCDIEGFDCVCLIAGDPLPKNQSNFIYYLFKSNEE